jgi:hypothetical protein
MMFEFSIQRRFCGLQLDAVYKVPVLPVGMSF